MDHWWCEQEPIRHIYLRAADGLWRLEATIGTDPPWRHDFAAEADARAVAQALMAWAPGHWQRQPLSRSAEPH